MRTETTVTVPTSREVQIEASMRRHPAGKARVERVPLPTGDLSTCPTCGTKPGGSL